MTARQRIRELESAVSQLLQATEEYRVEVQHPAPDATMRAILRRRLFEVADSVADAVDHEERQRTIYADIHWSGRTNEALRNGSAVLGLSQSGNSMMLVCMLGVVHYLRRRDSVLLSQHLRRTAELIEEHQ